MTYFSKRTFYKTTLSAAALSLLAAPAMADQVIADDLIVRGSACVGLDCANGESFGFDTIRLKENNVRLNFEDTSASASFPTNDWTIVANSTSNGGDSYLAFQDDDATNRLIFVVEAGAPANALRVERDGDVGIGIESPVVDLHMRTGNTPTIRLDQDGSNGFAAQVWDLAGNEANFFVRDVSNGSALPFRIFPGSGTGNALNIAGDGNIGMGTASPNAALHVNNGGADYAAAAADDIVVQDDGPARFVLVNTTAANPNWIFNSNNTLRISAGADAAEFEMDDSGNVTILGTLTENSNRAAKFAITPVDTDDVLEKVAALQVSAWTYKHDAEEGIRHMGPMAQDFHATFGLGAGPTGISTMDTSGVALAAIQALVKENRGLTARIDALEAELR